MRSLPGGARRDIYFVPKGTPSVLTGTLTRGPAGGVVSRRIRRPDMYARCMGHTMSLFASLKVKMAPR